jgi:hypothetical protein
MAWTGTNLTKMAWQEQNIKLQADAKRKQGIHLKIIL